MKMSNSPVPNLAENGHLVASPGRTVAHATGAQMAHGEAKRTILLRNTLPPGITIGRRTQGRERGQNRLKQWFVRYGKNRTTESFVTERARNDRAQELAAGVQVEGTKVLDFDPAEWRRLLLFKERTGIGLAEAEEIVMRVRGNLKLNLTVNEAITEYLGLRMSEGMTKESLTHPKLHLQRFAQEHGHLPLFAVTTEHVRKWMKALEDDGMGGTTRRHHRKNLNVFFARSVLEKWCVENPVTAVAVPKAEDTDVNVLTPRECFDLLKMNRAEPIVGRLAAELFGGIRCSGAQRLTYQQLRRDVKGVLFRAKDQKDEKRKFRQGQPDVFWAWIDHAGEAAWVPLIKRTADQHKHDAFVRAAVKNTGNVLRHTFASVMLASTRNMPAVSYLMQHASTKMTEKYEGVYTQADARLVLAMTPDAVTGTWEKFCKLQSKAEKAKP